MEFERSEAGELVKIHLIALFSVIFQASSFKQYSFVQVTREVSNTTWMLLNCCIAWNLTLYNLTVKNCLLFLYIINKTVHDCCHGCCFELLFYRLELDFLGHEKNAVGKVRNLIYFCFSGLFHYVATVHVEIILSAMLIHD